MANEAPTANVADIDYEAFGDVADEPETVETVAEDTAAPDITDEAATEAEAKEPEDEDDDLIDDEIDAKPEDADDPEFEIDADTKLKRSEIKELVEQKANYSRYNDELQIVAREKQAIEAQGKQIEEFIPKLRAEYDAALEIIRMSIPNSPDAAMMTTDPGTYLMMKEYREQAIARYVEVKEKGLAAVQKAQTEHSASVDAMTRERGLAEMDKLLKAVPALASDNKADAYLNSLTEFGKKYGYSAKEIQDTILLDHRSALILRKAALYDQSRLAKQPIAGQAKAVPSTPRSIPAPKRSSSAPQNGVDRRTLAKALQQRNSPNVSRSDLMDKAAAYFSD